MSDITLIRDITAKLRNLFCISDVQLRYDDGRIQVKTHNGKVLEKAEAFPYGFYAKAKSGKALVFCQDGNYNDVEILPILKDGDVSLPKLEEGDAALYTKEGGVIIARESGAIELYAKKSGNITIIAEGGVFYIANNKTNIAKILIGLIDEIKALVTTGSPASQMINEASKQKLDTYKKTIKDLLTEAP